MSTEKRLSDDQFVALGLENAREARQAAGLPEPRAEVSPDAGFLRRLWVWLTQGDGEDRKLWSSQDDPKQGVNERT